MSAHQALNAENDNKAYRIALEQGLIGSVFLNSDAIYSAIHIKPEHFFEPVHQKIWATALQYAKLGERFSFTSLKAALQIPFELGDIRSVGEYAAKIVAEGVPSLYVKADARRLLNSYVADRIVETALNIQSQAGTMPIESLVDQALASIDEARGHLRIDAGSKACGLGDGVQDILDRITQIKAGAFRVPSTGLPRLDTHLPMKGLAPKSLYVIGGRTGMGKTMFATSLARLSARSGGVCYFSLEVGTDEITARMMSDAMEAGPTYEQILGGNLTESEVYNIEGAHGFLADLPIHIDDATGLTIHDIEHRAKLQAARWGKRGLGLTAIVIDHAQIVKATGRYSGNRVGELGEVANAAKEMAKRLDTTVILLSQLNRGVESRDDKRPSISDIRASGEIEEAADVIGLLYRPAYYIEKSPEFRKGDPMAHEEYQSTKNRLEVLIEKSRQGRTGLISLWCDPSRSSVRDMEMNR